MESQYQQEWRAVEELKWARNESGKATNKAEEAHKAMVDFYANQPIPDWAMFPPNDGKSIIPYHLQMMGLDNPVSDRAAHLANSEVTERIRHYAAARGMSSDQIMENSLILYLRALEAEGKGLKVFLGSKPGDEVMQINLTPRVSPVSLDKK